MRCCHSRSLAAEGTPFGEAEARAVASFDAGTVVASSAGNNVAKFVNVGSALEHLGQERVTHLMLPVSQLAVPAACEEWCIRMLAMSVYNLSGLAQLCQRGLLGRGG